MADAQVTIEQRVFNKLVIVRFPEPLKPETERWFAEYLTRASGVEYIECRAEDMRLIGYGVWEPEWRNFTFWLEVRLFEGMLDDADQENQS